MTGNAGAVTVSRVEKTWLRRRLHLSGSLHGTVEYDGRGIGVSDGGGWQVYVNRRPVARGRYGNRLRHGQELEVTAGDERVAMAMRVQLSIATTLVSLQRFRLFVDSVLVYEEEDGEVVHIVSAPERPSYPIPSQQPVLQADELPIPADSEKPR